jgi:hypothetical protein
MTKRFYLFGLCCLLAIHASAQQKGPVVNGSLELHLTITEMDSLLFAAYNARNLPLMKTFFAKDLEWYQDNGGLLNYATVIKNFGNIFKRPYQLTRTLVPGSLQVYPIQNYGAIQTGSHQFRHIENGKEEVGTFQFMMIWRKEQGKWRITRVVSYGH